MGLVTLNEVPSDFIHTLWRHSDFWAYFWKFFPNYCEHSLLLKLFWQVSQCRTYWRFLVSGIESYRVKLMWIPWILFNIVFSSLATEKEKKDRERKKHKGAMNGILNTERSESAVLYWFQHMPKRSVNTVESRFYLNQQVWRATRRGCDAILLIDRSWKCR